jgi:hypothetical protein
MLWMRLAKLLLSSQATTQPDVRLTIEWRNSVVAWDDVDPSRFVRAMFPDEKRWRAEEAERDKLVVSRADVPVQERTFGRD